MRSSVPVPVPDPDPSSLPARPDRFTRMFATMKSVLAGDGAVHFST